MQLGGSSAKPINTPLKKCLGILLFRRSLYLLDALYIFRLFQASLCLAPIWRMVLCCEDIIKQCHVKINFNVE